MASLYVIKFKNDELSEPLDGEAVKYTIKKLGLTGDETIQAHPNGEWQTLKNHELFHDHEATFIRKLSDFGDLDEAIDVLGVVRVMKHLDLDVLPTVPRHRVAAGQER